MNVRKLLVLTLLAQRLVVSRQAIIPTRSSCRHKPRLQRVWRRGPFRFDIAQYEPTRWEWDKRMVRDSGRDTLERQEPVPVREHHLPKSENQPKLLWKSEHRHEDYDSLMESDDPVAVWPEPLVADRTMIVDQHDNVGTRFVKSPRNTDIGVRSVKSCEQRSPKVVEDSVEGTVRSSETPSGANICEHCGGLIKTTEVPSILTTTFDPSIIEPLDTVILLPPFEEAQSSNQILSIQPHPDTNNTMAILDVQINREAHHGKNYLSDFDNISSKQASDNDHMMLSSTSTPTTEMASNVPSEETINSTPQKPLDSLDEVTTDIPPQTTTTVCNDRFNGSQVIEVRNSAEPAKVSELENKHSSPVDVPGNFSVVTDVLTSTLTTPSSTIVQRIRQRHANSFSTPLPLQTSSQTVYESMSDDLMSTELCSIMGATRTSQQLNLTTIKTTTSTRSEGPSQGSLHENSSSYDFTQEYEASTESTTMFHGESVSTVTVPVVEPSTICSTEVQKPVSTSTIGRVETKNIVTQTASIELFGSSSTTAGDFFLPEMLPPLPPLDLVPDDDFAEAGGIWSQILKALLSLVESIFELFSDPQSNCDDNPPTLVDFGFDFSDEISA
ncbi:hypothetical protein ZHAS_00005539 [Anopheles sinensis]|uniref:Uncharacterized protein n=1 Tax=Anopheles sinensis TaxID=74873 RepID=A0A084VJT0_ANOSI|nr:hypothetical protein ZHAS_00005539 [Anopheles sinensis]